jgi:cytochrome b involved in lipid metabolism
MNKFLIPAILIIVLVAGGYFFLQNQDRSKSENMQGTTNETTTDPTNSPKESASDGEKTISLEEIALHKSSDDCWFAIENNVYDVTSFIASQKHPGGKAIEMGCGTDATELYNNRPNGSGAHSDRARSTLPDYLIGQLSEE